MTTMLRAAIMLAVLVGLPAAWIHYGPLPPRAQRVVDRFVASAKQMLDGDRIADADENLASPMESASLSASPLQRAGSPDPEAELARRVEPLLAKLRDLNVAAYALEPWGGERRLYRFHCEMPLAGSDAVTEQFEAIAADPQQAVAQVVADVTAWHGSRMVAAR